MKELRKDMARVQELVGDAFTSTGALVALTDGGTANASKLQKHFERTAELFERSTLEVRQLCEKYSPGVGGYSRRQTIPQMDVVGYAERFGYGWLHIRLNTLLPHCRYETPSWLSDTIRRLLDDYESCGNMLPVFQHAMLIIDEHSDIAGRHIFDQDNKGWKAISNAIKGRLIPDDDQYTLSISLLSTRSTENACHITLIDTADAADFFAVRTGDYGTKDFYGGGWT